MVNGRGEILLLKFIFGSKMWWVTPGGGPEEGERFEEALRREVFEETGVKLDEIGPWIWTKEIVLETEGRTIPSDPPGRRERAVQHFAVGRAACGDQRGEDSGAAGGCCVVGVSNLPHCYIPRFTQ